MFTNLLDKKWMLKTYAGEKISLIMVKITVDFISVALVFTTVFSFWIRLWWYQKLTPSDLTQPTPRLPGICCLWLSPSVVNLVTLHSEVWFMPHRVGQNACWCWDTYFPSFCWCLEGSGLPGQDGCCSMGDDWVLGSQWLLYPQSLCPESLLKHL